MQSLAAKPCRLPMHLESTLADSWTLLCELLPWSRIQSIAVVSQAHSLKAIKSQPSLHDKILGLRLILLLRRRSRQPSSRHALIRVLLLIHLRLSIGWKLHGLARSIGEMDLLQSLLRGDGQAIWSWGLDWLLLVLLLSRKGVCVRS